jgi:hypothetical protein
MRVDVKLDSVVHVSVPGSMTPLPGVGLVPGFPNFEDSAATDIGGRASSISSDDASLMSDSESSEIAASP